MTQPSAEANVASATSPRFGPLYRSLIVSVALPLIVVQVLLHRGTPPVVALAVAAIFPFADALAGLVRKRRFDPIAILSLAAIVAGVAMSGLSGNPAFAVAKESLFTSVFGLVFLGSLMTSRPLIFHLGRQFSTGGDPASVARWDALWERPAFRRVVRLMTAVWGCGLLLEALARVAVAFTLSVTVATIVSPVVGVGTIVVLVVWTGRYAKAVRARAAATAPAPAPA